jgi:hypothetical protein
MFSPTHHQRSRRRFGLTEVLLIVGILVFGGFALVNDGRDTVGALLSGVEHVLGG